MPAFVVEFDSNYGPERRLFTLDSDRELRPQMIQVLEELRLVDRVLKGGPGDELGVYWNGEELDLSLPLHALPVTTSRPLVLRMRPRPVAAVVAAPRAINWHAILRPPLEGALGALVAWGASSMLSDLKSSFPTADRIDIAVAVLLMAGIGVALAIGIVARGEMKAFRALPIVILAPLAAVSTLLGIAMLGPAPTLGRFLGSRVVAWALGSALLAFIVAIPANWLPSVRWGSALGFGALVGAVAAVLFSLPGPSLLWQAMAFLVAGFGVGFAALAFPAWRANSATEESTRLRQAA